MKKKTTIVTEEFDKDGNLVSKITETTEEEDNGYIYPQRYLFDPYEKSVSPGCNPVGA